MPRCGATFDDNNPLSGGVSVHGRWGGLSVPRKPTPSAFPTAVAAADVPLMELMERGFTRVPNTTRGAA